MENPVATLHRVTLTDLLDNVFDTKRDPGEKLTFEQIRLRLAYNLNLPRKSIGHMRLKNQIYHLVDIGMYNSSFRIGDDDEQEEVFSPGMPRAMDGMVNEEKYKEEE